MMILFYLIIAAAIGAMLVSLWLAMRLRSLARGGKIGRVVNLLLGFICVFTVCYLASPLFPQMPQVYVNLMAGLVFLFGAIFVIIVLRVIDGLVRQVFEELRLAR